MLYHSVKDDESSQKIKKRQKSENDTSLEFTIEKKKVIKSNISVDTMVYCIKYKSFQVSQVKMNNSQSLINFLFMQMNNFQKIISSDIFQSSFINEKLGVLDLQFNRVLFLSLINKEENLRERAIKISNIKLRSRSEHNRLIKKLKIKADLFKDLSDAVFRQEKMI